MFLFLLGLMGLSVGSFLNLAIYRIPKMINLSHPRSQCPDCKHTIKAIHNIPVLSYLFLKGKCAYCQHAISIRYPLIEIISTVLAVFIGWQYGMSWETAAGLIFTWGLLCMAVIDIDHKILPDSLTLSLLWIGLILNVFTDPRSAIIGAATGYVSLWLIAKIFTLITKKEGMGYGDFKLFAMLGAWLGWQMLPFIIFFASLTGSIVGISLMVFKKHSRNMPIPFGPFLATAGWLAWIFNNSGYF